ncbi:fungal-specific transcription factor domain-containing protein [Mycena vulgaris]|nr:fungal-specific transcription factor domain-containing protein [Mycena vulgaris]
MPVDKTKAPKTNAKRSQEPSADFIGQSVPGAGGVTHARELEVKRSRGEVSCAECRRLKIKCDKQIPCQSCVRRGCSALCPNGALATGQGTRFVLAATEHLHRKIARMGERIRVLEDALTALHASKGDGVGAHPLLVAGENFALSSDDGAPPVSAGSRRMSGTWDVLDGADGEGTAPASAGGDVIDAFGTLSISDHGISRFFGPTGGCEFQWPSLLIANLTNSPQSTTTASASASPSSLSLSRSSQSLSPPSTHASAPDSPARPAPHSTSPYSTAAYNYSPSHPSASSATLFSPSSFPLTPLGPPGAIHALVTSHLPPRRRARALVETYFTQLAWLFRGVTRGQVGDMMRAVYGAYGRPEPDGDAWEGDDDEDDEDGAAEAEGDEEEYTGPHDLALLFMVFAVGALVRPDEGAEARPRVAAEAEHLHQIARAALALQPVLEKPSLVTIQALHLLSIYNAMAVGPGAQEDAETSMEMTWSLITLAAHLSQTIGLHRDSARWGLSAKMVQRRRILFWDLFVADVWQSLNTGRPPSFSLAYIDCSFPTYENSKARDGIFEVWQFRFAAECVADVTARTLTTETPSYATIMELDRKVREFPLPPLDEAAPDDVGASLQRCVLEHIRETVLMYIHRSFFAQAIIEQPVNPLKSTYAPSFLAAYRASATILKSIREQFAVMPNPCARFWTMWTFAFSAAVVFGTVVTRGPRSPLAGAAMTELEQACVLFSKAAAYSRRVTKALPILTKLSEKARYALVAAQSEPSPMGDNAGLLWNMTGVLGPGGLPVKVKKEEPDDELSIFAGHTRFVSGQMQRGGPSSAIAPPAQHQQQQQHHPVGRVQHQQRHSEEMHYGSFEVSPPRQQYPAQYPAQEQAPPRQRLHSMPSASSFRTLEQPPQAHELERPAPTLNVNLNLNWDPRDYPQSAQEYTHPASASVMDERMHQHQQQFYAPDGARVQPSLPAPPSAPYAWPVDGYSLDEQQQHRLHQQNQQHQRHLHQQQQHTHYPVHAQQHAQQQQQQHYAQGAPDMYPNPQHAAAYQAHNAELAQLGLASRDSRLDERWSTFMEDSGLLDGIDFRAR